MHTLIAVKRPPSTSPEILTNLMVSVAKIDANLEMKLERTPELPGQMEVMSVVKWLGHIYMMATCSVSEPSSRNGNT